MSLPLLEGRSKASPFCITFFAWTDHGNSWKAPMYVSSMHAAYKINKITFDRWAEAILPNTDLVEAAGSADFPQVDEMPEI